ncbi:MAG: hypothetical protein ACOYJB_10140 [Christensenellaceae bacterium]
MKNVEMSVKENILTVEIDLSKDLGPSKSGKTNIVATTGGNVPISGREEKIGINVFRPTKPSVQGEAVNE